MFLRKFLSSYKVAAFLRKEGTVKQEISVWELVKERSSWPEVFYKNIILKNLQFTIPEVFCRKGVLKGFTKFTEKFLRAPLIMHHHRWLLLVKFIRTQQ